MALPIDPTDNAYVSPSVVLFKLHNGMLSSVAIAIKSLNSIKYYPPVPFPESLDDLAIIYPTNGIS